MTPIPLWQESRGSGGTPLLRTARGRVPDAGAPLRQTVGAAGISLGDTPREGRAANVSSDAHRRADAEKAASPSDGAGSSLKGDGQNIS